MKAGPDYVSRKVLDKYFDRYDIKLDRLRKDLRKVREDVKRLQQIHDQFHRFDQQ